MKENGAIDMPKGLEGQPGGGAMAADKQARLSEKKPKLRAKHLRYKRKEAKPGERLGERKEERGSRRRTLR